MEPTFASLTLEHMLFTIYSFRKIQRLEVTSCYSLFAMEEFPKMWDLQGRSPVNQDKVATLIGT